MKRKFFAAFLSLCMVMSLVPMTALAAEESWKEVSTAGELSSALGAGGNIKLTSDVELDKPVDIGNTTTIDLNGYSITPEPNWSRTEDGDYLVSVKRGGNLTIEDSSTAKTGKIAGGETGEVYAAVKVTITGENDSTTQAILTVNGGELQGCYYAVAGNGTRHNTKITINGGKLIGTNGAGIYHPQDGTLTIAGGEITGEDTAVELRSGTLKISGGKLTATAKQYSETQNNNGTTVSGAALAVSQHTTKKNISVTITGGEFNGVYALSETNVQNEENTENVKIVTISGGTFNGTVESDDCTDFIAGGTFSEDVSDYVQPGMKLEDGKVVIDEATAVAKIGSVGYDTLAAAIAAAQDGDTVTMLKAYDATSEETITLDTGKKVTLDLGGFELTLSRFNLVQGWLTVENGRVKSNPDNGQAFNVYAGSTATDELYTKLVIEDDVTINAAYGICLFPGSGNAGYSSAIEVYGNIATGGIFVSGNLGNDISTAGDMASSNKIPTVTIYDGAVVNNGTEGQGIAMNGLANVTVNGGTITGSEAIGVKRGTLTVNGGDFNSNGAYVDPIEANNNGTENTGATISITSTYNYAGTIAVNINGGTFTSKNAPAVYLGHSEKNDALVPYTKGVALDIQGGTFTSLTEGMTPIYVANKESGDAESYTKEVISGGSFKESVAQYVTSDLKYEANANGIYTYHKTLEEALKVSDTVSSVEAAKDSTNAVTVTVKNGNDVDTIKLTSGTEYSLLNYPDQGYNHFVGWTDQDGNHYCGGQTVKITANTTFTAQWAYIPPANPNYRIDIPAAEGGTVTADPAAAKAGATVTLTATPDEGYAVGTITVTDRFGDAVKVTENADGTYTFTMPNGQVTVKATFVETEEPTPAEPFPDVDENDWFYDEVVYVYENGLMNGVENNQFAPNTATNRAMLATILYRLAGQPDVSGDLPFTDVAAGTWYTDAVLWAAQNGIVNGLGENTFAPMNTLTREQLVTMLYRYAQNKGYDVSASADLSGYPDAGQVQDYAQPAMAWAVAENIIQGMEDGTLKPAGNASRAQIATILMRFCEDVAQ